MVSLDLAAQCSRPNRSDVSSPCVASAPCCFVVRGLGERAPARVQLADPGDLDFAAKICDDEIKLVEAAIEAGRIPMPEVLGGDLPRFDVAVECLAPTNDTMRLFRHPVANLMAPMVASSERRNFWVEVGSVRSRSKFSVVADEIAEIAGRHKVVVVGQDARALASALRIRGSEVDYLRSRRSLLPRRWRRHTFTEWLQAHGDDMTEVGAVVLMSDGDFAFECAALRDADVIPPIVCVMQDEVGVPHVAEVLPAETPDTEGPWPKISVVTVSFNQATYLEASIRSVLDQNYPNLEYIIVDGGSTDGSIEIIERYRDRCDVVIVEPDRGQSDALNKGFARATGEMMNWLCSDDLLEPGSLARVGRAYRRHGADIIAGGCVRIGETREEERYRHHTRLPFGRTMRLAPLDMLHFMRSWQDSNYFYQPEVFFSRRAWLASGAYIKEHLFYLMDYDLWLRMALAGATARHIPMMIGCSRIHAAQKTRADRKYLHQIPGLMEEYKALFAALKASADASLRGFGERNKQAVSQQ